MSREDKCQLKSCMMEEGEYTTINRALAPTWTVVVCEVGHGAGMDVEQTRRGLILARVV